MRNKVNNKEFEQIVIDAATNLIMERGIKGWNMDELALKSGVSKKTLYSIIGTKEKLLSAIFLEEVHSNIDKIVNIFLNTKDYYEVVDKICNEIPKHLGGFASKYSYQMKLEYPTLSKEITAHFEKQKETLLGFFKKCIDKGIFRKETDPEFILVVIKALIAYFLQKNYSEDKFVGDSQKALRMLFNGIIKEKK